MTILKKIGIGIVCAIVLVVVGDRCFSWYAIYRAPHSMEFAFDKEGFARGYLFTKASPLSGSVYEDEYYSFQLLRRSHIAKVPNGYEIKIPDGGTISISEFASWDKYLEYNDLAIKLHRGRRTYPETVPYKGKLSFDILVPEVYGEILAERQVTLSLKSGESCLGFDSNGSAAQHHILCQKESGHIVDVAFWYRSNPQVARNIASAFYLLAATIKLKKDLPVDDVTYSMVDDFKGKYVYVLTLSSKRKEKTAWRYLP